MSEQSNSKRLAKNTLLMYLRMVFLMLISLYTSRVVLHQLGVEDYGIYNLVGSLVAMFVSLKFIFGASTQRFLNYEMGKGNHDKLQLIYNLSTYINAIIAFVFFVLVEVVGVWFLTYNANIPESRLFAAHMILQFSIVSTIISIMNTPLDACVIAHERMDFYAYLSIFDGLAKLGICYLLSIGTTDKLIKFGALTLVISVIVRIINRVFCYKKFQECRLEKMWDKEYFKKMASYASWAFLGNTAYAFAQSGLNMVLNVFGGPIVNAARGIAYQVSTAIWSFISNIIIVLKPHTVKSYAQGDKAKAFKIAYLSSKLYFYILLVMVIMFAYLANYIIQLWLGMVPEYSVVFLNLVLIQSLIKSLQMPLDMLFSAEGNIKFYQLFEGIVLFFPVPVSYFLLKQGLPYYSVFCAVIFFEVIHIIGIAFIGGKVFGLNLSDYFRKVIFPCTICSIACLGIYYLSQNYLTTLINNVLAMIVTMIVATLITVLFTFSRDERNMLKAIIKRK